jgi:hypothetical protein
MEAIMELQELHQRLVTCIDHELSPGRDRGERLQACRDMQRLLMGAALWLEGCRARIDLECAEEPTLEAHVAGIAEAVQNVRWVQV